jgi:hypothetical protein
MVPEDLLVWLEAVDPQRLTGPAPGLLCRRHADAMVVPIGWTLDDRREPTPRLFRVRDEPRTERTVRDVTGGMRRPRVAAAEALALFDDAVATPAAPAEAEVRSTDEHAVVDETVAWEPRFDTDDDLGGLLRPRGALLRRAFGTDQRDPGEA